MYPISQLCERARAWSSLRADGELSDLESALLDGHLGGCAACRSFAVGAASLAETLRSARLERPSVALGLPTGERRSHALRALQLTVAAAVVLAAGAVASASAPGTRVATAKPVAMVAGLDSPDRLRELRRPALVEKGRALARNRQAPGVPV